MKEKYIYPAIFDFSEKEISIEFPDLEGAYSCGNTFETALENAKECLEAYLNCLEETGEDIPIPNSIKNYELKNNQQFILIQADMISFKKKYDRKTIKKTLTIPKWLNDLAVEKKINFSKLLRKSLEIELESYI